MATDLTPEAIAELRRLNEERLKFRDWPSARSASTSAEWMNAAAEKFPALLDAAERCAAAEAQAKAAGELLRALNEAMDLIHELRSYCRETWDWKYGKEWDDQTKAVAERIEAAERAGVKP